MNPPHTTETTASQTAQPAPIRTLSAAFTVFWSYGSPKVLSAGVAAAVALRATAFGYGVEFTWFDLLAPAVVALASPFLEWIVHRSLLHHEPIRWRGVKVETSLGHIEHHRSADSLDHTLLAAPGALAMQIGGMALAAALIGAPLAIAGGPVVGPALTGMAFAAAGALHYEWAHYLFHTAYRPRMARYRRLKVNHRRHHWRNDQYWMGITSNLADRVFRTLPKNPGAVPHRSIRREQRAALVKVQP